MAEELKEGDVAIAFDVYRRYQQRVKDAEAVWQEFLKPGAGHDFTVREVVIIDPKARDYPKDAKVFREQWRLWLKYRLLTMKADPSRKDFDLDRACEELSASHARFARGVRIVKAHQVLESFLRHVGGTYDSGTTYTSPATVKDYEAAQRGHFFGVGITWNPDGRIESIIPGGSAASDGRLKSNDRIVSVGQGSSGDLTDITRLTQNEAMALIRGEDGTTVRLGIQRAGENRVQVIALRRGKVFLPESKVEARLERAGTSKVGYLDVPNFYLDDKTGESTVTEVRRHLENFKTQSADIVVLDLRRCQGGYLSQALALAGLFLDKGAIIQVKNQAGGVSTQENQDTEMVWNKPVVVLVGRGTGSGAEIVCAAIQDYKRGLIVGDDVTAGAGLIRSQMNVADNMGFLLVTTAQFYRVNGEAFQQRGVKPDVQVPSPATIGPRAGSEAGSNFGFDRLKGIEIQPRNMVTTETVLALKKDSRERRRASAEFKTLQTLTEWEHGQTTRSIETLNETEYRARLKDVPADDLPTSKPGKTDFHLQEVFTIATDYARAVGSRTAVATNIVQAPPREDPVVVRRRELANQREAARQSVQYWEDEIRVLNNKVVGAQVALVVAKKVYDDAEAGSVKEIVAELAYIATQRALADIKADLTRAESELQSARNRYNRLRE